MGHDKTPVSVHSAVMASLSAPFDRLINGPMIEAQERRAEIPDIELEIFLLLVEFAYTLSYTTKPCPNDSLESRKDDLEDAEEAEESLLDELDIVELCLLKEEALTNATLKEQWRERKYMPWDREFWENFPRSGDYISHSSKSTHEAYYLMHAKLYSLGERYMIPHLKLVAVQKLHTVLCDCDDMCCLSQNGQHEPISAAMSLILYAYSNNNTPDRGADGRHDLLRQEVLEFAVISMADLQNHSSFTGLVASNQELAADIIRLMQRLHNDGVDSEAEDDEEEDE